jgi:hypothetical protein
VLVQPTYVARSRFGIWKVLQAQACYFGIIFRLYGLLFTREWIPVATLCFTLHVPCCFYFPEESNQNLFLSTPSSHVTQTLWQDVPSFSQALIIPCFQVQRRSLSLGLSRFCLTIPLWNKGYGKMSSSKLVFHTRVGIDILNPTIDSAT